jgi:soluble lytic murein transglycosylase
MLRRAGRVLAGATLVAGLAVPVAQQRPTNEGARANVGASETPRLAALDASAGGADAQTAVAPLPASSATPVTSSSGEAALALAPSEGVDAPALRAMDRATALAPDALAPARQDAITEAVARFAEAADPTPLALDTERLRAVVAAYRGGDLAGGDALARALSAPEYRLAAEWAALKLQPRHVGRTRLSAFLAAHPDWPSARWIERRIEETVYAERKTPRAALEAFRERPPQTLLGELALAYADLGEGRADAAATRVRRLWREETLAGGLEQATLRDFGALLTPSDRKTRSDRLFYDDKSAASLAEARAASPEAGKLAEARAVAGSKRFDALVAALPKELSGDPTLAYARARAFLNAGKPADAAKVLIAAPSDPAALIDGDAWWDARRDAARALLDHGDAETAYKVAAGGGAKAASGKVEAAFTAGWIALRHLPRTPDNASRAKAHFDAAAAIAATPASSARAAYWQGRALEALGDMPAARAAYAAAAQRPSTFYGQLGAAKIDGAGAKLRQAAPAAESDFTRAFRALYEARERALAQPLALDAAKIGGRDGELALLSDWLARRRDARTALAIGKAALVAGGALDETAFPTYGVPAYVAAPNSAETAVVYSIARQESAFQTDVISPAGAKGLMQMLDSTARETARRAGLPFEERRMLSDPAFNAQLGAAHLGTLLTSQKGSYLLAFAAYNAGAGRVKEWIAAYGDPREPGVDPIDWIERIPIAETRDYVQKTLENLQVYRQRLGERAGASLDADLRRGARQATR